MTSNAYIATDGETVMKVGKANNVKLRERQIAIPITFTIACLNEEAAFRVERKLRDFVIKNGGIKKARTIDWFRFDPQIYKMLCEFTGELDGQAIIEHDLENEIDIDREIKSLVNRYYQLLLDELSKEKEQLREEEQKLREEYRQLQQQHNTEMERLLKEKENEAVRREGELREQIGELKAMLRMSKERGNDQ